MRAFALLVILASGCSLYFPSGHSSDDDVAWPPDARPGPYPGPYPVPPDAWIEDAGSAGSAQARCEDGQLYQVTTDEWGTYSPPHGEGRPIGRCGGSCRSAAVQCTTADCSEAAQTLCNAPVSVGATCPLDGDACRGTASIQCPESTACSIAVPGSTCACANGSYRCTQDTAAAAIQSKIVGKWRGTVTTPFSEPYPVTLWIYPDGTYWAECSLDHCVAFYYGGDGPDPDRKITILSTSQNVGSWADIVVDFGFDSVTRGELSALVVDASTLRFTYSAAWLTCGQPVGFTLTRD